MKFPKTFKIQCTNRPHFWACPKVRKFSRNSPFPSFSDFRKNLMRVEFSIANVLQAPFDFWREIAFVVWPVTFSSPRYTPHNRPLSFHVALSRPISTRPRRTLRLAGSVHAGQRWREPSRLHHPPNPAWRDRQASQELPPGSLLRLGCPQERAPGPGQGLQTPPLIRWRNCRRPLPH